MFLLRWFDNNIILIQKLLCDNGLLLTYSRFKIRVCQVKHHRRHSSVHPEDDYKATLAAAK